MTKKFYDKAFQLGILGGGQLGKMLIQACGDLNINTHILDSDHKVPAAGICDDLTEGDFKQYEDVLAIGEQVDLLTIEIEHVNLRALYELVEKGIPVYPQPSVLEIIQDKGRQKDFYYDCGIPTAEYRHATDQRAVYDNRDFLPAFQKSCKAGYDGKGVQLLKSENDLPNAFDTPSILEKAIDCEKELSVIVARNTQGAMQAYPPVEMAFHPEQNLVEYLFSPADIPEDKASEAIAVAKDVASKLDVVGLLAVELFLTQEGNILVNESAPRPHNSGHHTIEANDTSQYEQHLRAIMGLPLGDPRALSKGAMVNLLGEPDNWGRPFYEGIEEAMAIPGAHPHIYGKQATKPHRKMGHVTLTGDTLEIIRKNANFVKNTLKVISHE